MENLIGRSLGPYQITDLIGQTATGGTLYKAYQPWLKRHVTIKTLPPHLAGDHGFAQRMRTASRLTHRNIAAIYDLRQDHNVAYLVTEYVEGTSLDKTVWPGEGLSPRAILPVFEQLASALDYAHSQGMIHGSLRPDNILLTRDRRPVITDFGLALTQGPAPTMDLDALKYTAPEQIQGRPADPRTDVYSLGVVLYFMLTGKAPIEGTTSQAIRSNLVTQSPVPPSQLNRNLSSAMDAVVLKALHKNPAQRYQRAGDLLAAFRATVARTPAPATTQPDFLKWGAIGASVVLFLIIVGLGAVWVQGRGGSPPTPTLAAETQAVPAAPVVTETSAPITTGTWTPIPVAAPSRATTITPRPGLTQQVTSAADATATASARQTISAAFAATETAAIRRITPQPTSTPRHTMTPKPTATPGLPAPTSLPPTATPAPQPTKPAPPPTDTPLPRPTDTPPPVPTDTPRPRPTDTPPPLPTDTPPPLPTDTPPPLPSNTPPPLPTNTPPPLPTNTSPPLP